MFSSVASKQFLDMSQQSDFRTGRTPDVDNKLSLQFHPKIPANYRTGIIFISQNKADIRVIDISVIAHPQVVKAQLEFVVPARKSVTQEIPFNNEAGQTDWTIKVNLQDNRSKTDPGRFTGKPGRDSFTVQRRTTTNYKLTFEPYWMCEISGKLMLTNVQTNQTYEYELKGIGEPPLAEDHIILKCRAKHVTQHVFEIRNDSDKPITYRVETDLQNCTGSETLKVFPKSVGKYHLQIKPLLGGNYIGQVTFIDPEERYIWYTVEISTESPKAEKVLELKTYVRKAVMVEIGLKNPLNEMVSFDVQYTGAGLIGDPVFLIPPNKSATYELIYSPLSPAEGSGNIGFLNEKVRKKIIF
jgi:hypothetical protein